MKDNNENKPLALKVEHLTVNYDKTPVLWDISLSIPSGCLVGIIGPNGAGKSTFIKTIIGLIKAISGKIELSGKTLKQTRKNVAYVPQKEAVDWEFPITALDVVLMGRYGHLGLFRWPRKADKEAAKEVLKRVGMEAFSHRQINQLSGGQQQRIFLARALLQNADIYFMDEPFSGVDLASEKVIMLLLNDLKKQGKTVFVIHHDLNNIETYFDRVIMLNMRLITYGKTSECFTSEMLSKTFGKNNLLLSEVMKLSQNKTMGIK